MEMENVKKSNTNEFETYIELIEEISKLSKENQEKICIFAQGVMAAEQRAS